MSQESLEFPHSHNVPRFEEIILATDHDDVANNHTQLGTRTSAAILRSTSIMRSSVSRPVRRRRLCYEFVVGLVGLRLHGSPGASPHDSAALFRCGQTLRWSHRGNASLRARLCCGQHGLCMIEGTGLIFFALVCVGKSIHRVVVETVLQNRCAQRADVE